MAEPEKNYEDRLGDSLEKILSEGCTEPDDIAAALNRYGPPHPENKTWSEEVFVAELARLAG